jgi:hypothetical protein
MECLLIGKELFSFPTGSLGEKYMEHVPNNKIGILKSIWKKNDAGVWAGHDLKGIDLKPREGFLKGLFQN